MFKELIQLKKNLEIANRYLKPIVEKKNQEFENKIKEYRLVIPIHIHSPEEMAYYINSQSIDIINGLIGEALDKKFGISES
jgi:hypothetical protein